jgi:uncharacterized damage-inducible protein DinB
VPVKSLALAAVVCAATLHGQTRLDPLEGLWRGFDGEWVHVSKQLVALAEAFPQEKYAWRPGPGVRSTSEVFMHIVITDFYLLSVTGPKMPADMQRLCAGGPCHPLDMEKAVTSKPEVIAWLKRSLDAVKTARAARKPGDLQKKVKTEDRDIARAGATVDGMYLRIIIHANEHMGQLVAYARVNGITQPWSETPAK